MNAVVERVRVEVGVKSGNSRGFCLGFPMSGKRIAIMSGVVGCCRIPPALLCLRLHEALGIQE